MIEKVAYVLLLVRDQQEALTWYTEKLGFDMRANDPFPDNSQSRWITIAPPGQKEIEIVLQPPEWGAEGNLEDRKQLIGKAPGFILSSTDCRKDYEELSARGVRFLNPPTEEPWGISAFLVDLYGYVHNLVESRE